MSVLARTGHFIMGLHTGVQTFRNDRWLWTPKIILFYPSMLAGVGIDTDTHVSFGAAVSPSERFALSSNSENGQGTSDATRTITDAQCIKILNPGLTTTFMEADFVAHLLGGFSLDVTTPPSARRRVIFLALGGSDLSVNIGTFTSKGSAGSDSFTGVGFQPDSLLFAYSKQTTIPQSANTAVFGLGMTSGVGAEGAFIVTAADAQAASNTKRHQRDDRCILAMNSSGGAIEDAILESLDADGATVDWQAASTAMKIPYIALKGGQFFSTSFTSQTGTGEFSITNVPFRPKAGIYYSFCNPETDVVQDDLKLSLGVATGIEDDGGTKLRGVTGGVEEDNQDPTDGDNFVAGDRIYQNYGFGQSLVGDFDFVSFNEDGATFDETDADDDTNEILALFVGDPAARDNTRQARISYNMRVTGNEINEIVEISTGRIIPPEELLPNTWMKVLDVFTTSLALETDPARDPQISFIEAISFSGPNSVTITTSRDKQLSILVAKIGQGSTSPL